MNLVFVHCPLPENLKEKIKQAFSADTKLVFSDGIETECPAEFYKTTILLGGPPPSWIEKAKKLQFWQIDSAGFEIYSKIVTAAKVCNMGDFFALPCAETVVGGLLAYYRKINVLLKAGYQKQWIGKSIRKTQQLLNGSNTLILGAGHIAANIADLLKAFKCPVSFFAKTNPKASITNKKELIKRLHEFDLVINTLPGSAVNFVSEEFINAMKNGAVYANIGRGATTDETALVQAIDTGKLSAAVLDVTETEPIPADSKLWNHENIILTQHNGGGVFNEAEAKTALFLENIARQEKNLPLKNLIDLNKGY